MSKTYTRDEVVNLVQELIAAHGNQHELARALNITPGYISNVVCGHCPPGPALLAPLGLEAITVIVYREVANNDAP